MRALQAQAQAQAQAQDLPVSPTSTSQEASHYSNRASQAVKQMVDKLSPLIAPGLKVQIQEALLGLAQSAVDVWDLAQTDELKIVARLSLNPSDRETWRSARFDPIRPADDTFGEMGIKSSTRPRVFTLFPQVIAQWMSPTADPSPHIPGSFSTPQQEVTMTETSIHPGIGLPECSVLVVLGKEEAEDNKKLLEEAIANARKEARSGRKRLSSHGSIPKSVSRSLSGLLSPSSRWAKG